MDVSDYLDLKIPLPCGHEQKEDYGESYSFFFFFFLYHFLFISCLEYISKLLDFPQTSSTSRASLCLSFTPDSFPFNTSKTPAKACHCPTYNYVCLPLPPERILLLHYCVPHNSSQVTFPPLSPDASHSTSMLSGSNLATYLFILCICLCLKCFCCPPIDKANSHS